ncbi:MAG: hypothetical protein IMZ62_01970 [Chloroflexi bacterium]|nr:hypothetical protein [Chloroflexota bacterium]
MVDLPLRHLVVLAVLLVVLVAINVLSYQYHRTDPTECIHCPVHCPKEAKP